MVAGKVWEKKIVLLFSQSWNRISLLFNLTIFLFTKRVFLNLTIFLFIFSATLVKDLLKLLEVSLALVIIWSSVRRLEIDSSDFIFMFIIPSMVCHTSTRDCFLQNIAYCKNLFSLWVMKIHRYSMTWIALHNFFILGSCFSRSFCTIYFCFLQNWPIQEWFMV